MRTGSSGRRAVFCRLVVLYGLHVVSKESHLSHATVRSLGKKNQFTYYSPVIWTTGINKNAKITILQHVALI